MARAAERSDEPGKCATVWPLVSGGVGSLLWSRGTIIRLGRRPSPLSGNWHGRRPGLVWFSRCIVRLRRVVPVDLAERGDSRDRDGTLTEDSRPWRLS